MNKRIKELAEQAEIYADAILDAGGDFHIPYTEKFAELLIQECASIAAGFSAENKRFHPDIYPGDMPMDRRMVYHSTCQSVAYEIKEHFGVE